MNEGSSSSSSSSLPYEIVKKEGQEQEKTGGGKKYAAMKRVEAFIAAEKTGRKWFNGINGNNLKVVRNKGGRLEVFMARNDKALYHRWQTKLGGTSV
jgi:hypothetical protein